MIETKHEFECAMCLVKHYWCDLHDSFCDTKNTETIAQPNMDIIILRCYNCSGVAAIACHDHNTGEALYVGDKTA